MLPSTSPGSTTPPGAGVGTTSQSRFRLAILILSVINNSTAFALCARVAWDACSYRKIPQDIEKGGSGRSPTWPSLSGKELYPLIFGVAVLLQGGILVVVESHGMRGYDVLDGTCKRWATIAWPGVWIPIYINLVFAADTAIRVTTRLQLEPRSWRGVAKMMAGAIVLLVLTSIPAGLRKWEAQDGVCTGDLMTLMAPFSAIGVVALSAMLLSTFFLTGIILWGLIRGTKIGMEQRIAFSRELFFILANVLQWILILPNYFTGSSRNHLQIISSLATVVINISGIIALALHLYLRKSNMYIARHGSSDITITYSSKGIVRLHSADSSTILRNGTPCIIQTHAMILESTRPSSITLEQNRLSASTATLNRVGDEITSLMVTLLNSTRSTTHLSPSAAAFPQLTVPFSQQSEKLGQYTHYRPASVASTASTASSSSNSPLVSTNSPLFPMPPTRLSTVKRMPSRPSRTGVPLVNVEREQDLGNSARRDELLKEIHSHTQTGTTKSLFEVVQNTSPKLGVE